MLMLIAPSKTQECNCSCGVETTQPLLLQESQLSIEELKQYSVADLAKLMKMSERLALQTFQRMSDFELPFNTQNACPAITVFQGDVYSKIRLDDYRTEENEYLQKHLRILSGLYGILRPFDLMQVYRLEMGCKLATHLGKNLYEFWGERITAEVKRILAGHTEAILVNLASTEYSRVLNMKSLPGSVLQVDFKERKGDAYRTVAIHAKRARGMMVDFAVKNRVKKSIELKAFQQDGYSFHPDLSSNEHYCFTRASFPTSC